MKIRNFQSVWIFTFLILLFSGCSDEFANAELGSDCFKDFPTVDYYRGQHGTIQSKSLNDVPNLILIGDLKKNGYYLFPCNLPAKYQLRGTEVIFDADIKDVPTERCDTLTDGTIHCVPLAIDGTPITLTSLKVKELF